MTEHGPSSSVIANGLLAAALLCSLVGCQAIPKDAKVALAKPVDCTSAPQDIAVLREEHASVGKRFLEGVTAVVPAGAVIGILTLQEKDKLEVAIGVYNKKLKHKIEEIQQACGLQ